LLGLFFEQYSKERLEEKGLGQGEERRGSMARSRGYFLDRGAYVQPLIGTQARGKKEIARNMTPVRKGGPSWSFNLILAQQERRRPPRGKKSSPGRDGGRGGKKMWVLSTERANSVVLPSLFC